MRVMKKGEYWDDFYGSLSGSLTGAMPPSQFAAFCRVELLELDINQLIDIAAGDGRDSIFFAHQGVHTLALDSSMNAVDLITKKVFHSKRLRVIKFDAVDGRFPKPTYANLACAYYARFFIHTLDENQLRRFLGNLSKAMNKIDYFFIEYRNEKDEALDKVMPHHFRKFYKTDFVSAIANQNQLKCIYEVEGRGFAKWKSDDAFVTRQIFIKDEDN